MLRLLSRMFPPARRLLSGTLEGWSRDRVPRLAAALAFYTLFSIAPLLLVAIAVAGLLFGEELARGHVLEQLRRLIGEQGAQAVRQLIESARRPGAGMLATVVGIVALLVGASGAFAELQGALNVIWGVRKRSGRGLLGMVRDRFLSFSLVIGIGFLLLVSLLFSAALEAAGEYVQGWTGTLRGLKALNTVVSFVVVAALFATMFRVVPDARIRWKDVWGGAVLTALLFSVGRHAIGLYLGKNTVASAYGAAGSFVVFLLWVYYTAQILLLGAEFTQVYAQAYGSGIHPQRDAVRVSVPAARDLPAAPPRTLPSSRGRRRARRRQEKAPP